MTPSIKIARPNIALYNKFLTDVECAFLIWMAQDKLERCTVMDNSDGTSVVDTYRTSYGMCFKVGENPIVDYVEKKISAITGYPIENGEGIQILRYRVGQEYRPHFDYFDPQYPGTQKEAKNNRVCTVLMYLNTPDSGGATVFPDANVEIAPKQGAALVFSYDTPTKDTLTLHGGAPVLEGEKWVATKWIRRNKY